MTSHDAGMQDLESGTILLCLMLLIDNDDDDDACEDDEDVTVTFVVDDCDDEAVIVVRQQHMICICDNDQWKKCNHWFDTIDEKMFCERRLRCRGKIDRGMATTTTYMPAYLTTSGNWFFREVYDGDRAFVRCCSA